MKQKVKDILKNLKDFQIPMIAYESTLSEAERANLYFYLTSVEMESQKQTIEEKQTEEIRLKRVKLFHVCDEANDAVWNFNSFKFKQEDRNLMEPDQKLTFKDQNITFNTLNEIKQFLKQQYNDRKIPDEIQTSDKQQVIQSLNIYIQQSTADVNEVIGLFQSILFKEIEFRCQKRYDYYLDTFCTLIKQKASFLMSSSDTQKIAEKFISSVPQYRISVIDLLREFTEQALLKQNEELYRIYFTLFRDLVYNFLTEQNPLQYESLKLLLKVNHQSTLDFVKAINKQLFQTPETKEIVYDDAIQKINSLSGLADCTYQLTYIFYVGCTQQINSKHCKILAKLLQDCAANYSQHLKDIHANLQKIKENVKTMQIIKFIGLSITNPDLLHQKLLDLFIDFALQNNETDIFAQEMFKTYLYRYFTQTIEGDVAVFNRIISLTFDQLNIPFIIQTIEKLPLERISAMLLKKGNFDLFQYIEKDESKEIAIYLIKLFLKKEYTLLKENSYELLKKFQSQIIEYPHTKEVLNFIFQEQKQKSFNGLIASFIINCLKKKKANMVEEIRYLLQKGNYVEDEQIIKTIESYRQLYPEQYTQLLDDQTRLRLRDKRLL